MPALDHAIYLEHLERESARFREVLTGADPTARVPSCPDWDAADLVWHLAEVQWFWAQTIRVRPQRIEQAQVERPARPEGLPALLAAAEAAAADLLDQLGRADPAEAAYHWSDDQTVGASFSRQAHEALVHRVDAEQTAAAEPAPIDAALAADGVREVLELMRGGDLPDWLDVETRGGPVAVVLNDSAMSWCLQPTRVRGTDPDSGTGYDQGHLLTAEVEPVATVRGDAADVDLWLWNRRGDRDLELSGDPVGLEAFVAAATDPLE